MWVRFRPMLGRHWLLFDKRRGGVYRTWSGVGPESTHLEAKCTSVGSVFAKLGPVVDQIRPNLARRWPEFERLGPISSASRHAVFQGQPRRLNDEFARMIRNVEGPSSFRLRLRLRSRRSRYLDDDAAELGRIGSRSRTPVFFPDLELEARGFLASRTSGRACSGEVVGRGIGQAGRAVARQRGEAQLPEASNNGFTVLWAEGPPLRTSGRSPVTGAPPPSDRLPLESPLSYSPLPTRRAHPRSAPAAMRLLPSTASMPGVGMRTAGRRSHLSRPLALGGPEHAPAQSQPAFSGQTGLQRASLGGSMIGSSALVVGP